MIPYDLKPTGVVVLVLVTSNGAGSELILMENLKKLTARASTVFVGLGELPAAKINTYRLIGGNSRVEKLFVRRDGSCVSQNIFFSAHPHQFSTLCNLQG